MSQDFKFGKKILNTLTTGMYKNAMFIYREYIQNAADAIDDAVDLGLKSPEGFQILVKIDSRRRSISVEDNGTGIPEKNVAATLGNIGDSRKDPRKKKGFIGIGRLGGLGYCKKVIFETTCHGESVKTISEWDAESIREIIYDSSVGDDAQTVLLKTVTFRTEPCDAKSHYFKVSLCDIAEENEELLDEKLVYQYLQMVAPTEFHYGDFPFRQKIRAFIREKNLPELNEYEIFLNHKKIRKGYKSKLVVPGKKDSVEIKDIGTGIVEANGKVLGWYWYGITDFSGTMEKFWQSGMRLRKGNIQIGEEDCLYQHKMWRERRGNFYFFGEVHALDPDLIPNGRRDYFEENIHCRRFESSLKDIFDKMLDIVYAASNVRSASGKVEKTRDEIARLNDKIKSGSFDSTKSRNDATKKLGELNDTFNGNVASYNKILSKWEEKKEDVVVGVAVTSILDNAKVNTRPVKITSESSTSKPAPLATDALTASQRKVLDIVKSVLLKKLPQEEFDFIWDEVLKKIKSV